MPSPQTRWMSMAAAFAVFVIGGCAVDNVDAGTTPALDLGGIPQGDAVLAKGDVGATGSRDLGPSGDAGDADVASPGEREVGAFDARSVDAGRPPPDLPLPDAGVDIPVTLPRRSCSVTLTYADPAARVEVAGEFTGWGEAPRELRPDPAGGFSIELGPADGLTPGATYGYKLIVDGTWRLDPAQTRQKFDGACVNSAFQVPDCDARPDLSLAETLRATPAGELDARVRLNAATVGSDQGYARFRLDGQPIAGTFSEGTYGLVRPGLSAGKHILSATAVDLDGREAVPLDLPFWIEGEGSAPPLPAFEWGGATLYMLMIDRFANGSRQNDEPGPESAPYANNWHGGDLQGVQAVLESGYFERMGINALWLSPVNMQAEEAFPGLDANAQPFTGYHGYWPVRAREIEPRFGGNDALRSLVRAAHARGIRILLDLINNQVHEQHEYYQAHPDWFRTACVCGSAPGCGWSERPLDCLFAPYLPDINWRVADAERQFIEDAVAWVADYGVDGFRVDAVKHVETTAIYNLRAALDERFAGPGASRLVMLGETAVGEGDRFDDGCGERYDSGYDWIGAYTGPHGLDGQFDFPTHHRTQYGLLTDTMGYDSVEQAVRDLETRYRPAIHVRFLGSHDSNRAATRAARDPAAECRSTGGPPCERLPGVVRDAAVYGRLRRAFAILYSLPGIPLLYSGDEFAMPGGNDPDNRRDMLFDAELSGVALSVTSPTDEQRDFARFMADLGRTRALLPALRGGRRTALVASGDLWVVDFTDASGAQALVVVNRGGEVTDFEIPVPGEAGQPGTVADRLLFGTGAVEVDGLSARLSVPAGGVAFFSRP